MGHTLIFDHAHQKPFNQLLTFVNLYQHIKNEAVSSICSGEMLDLKIPQSEWLRAFWPVSQEQSFSQIENLYRKTTNNINFSEKIWDELWRNAWVKNSTIWMAEGTLACISGTTFQLFLFSIFLKLKICTGKQQKNFSLKYKKPYFSAISHFWAKKVFPKNLACTTW